MSFRPENVPVKTLEQLHFSLGAGKVMAKNPLACKGRKKTLMILNLRANIRA